MAKKKIEIEPVVSAVVSKDAAPKAKKAAAKPRATKKVAVAAETKKPRTVTHRHKKAEIAVEAVSASTGGALSPAQIHDAIAAIAYSYYEARGYQPGSPDADWMRAEQEFWSRLAK